MALRRRKQTWLEVAIKNAGFRTGIKAVSWMLSWVVVREVLGYDPSVDEVAEWWKQSRRTAFREQDAFRKAFPEFLTPAPMYESAEAQAKLAELMRRVKNLETMRKASTKDLDGFALEIAMLPASL
jgi:hypothetical protein